MTLSTTLCALSMSIALATAHTGKESAQRADRAQLGVATQVRFEIAPAQLAPARVGEVREATPSVERLLATSVAKPPSAEDLVSDRFEWKFEGLKIYDAEDDPHQPATMRLYPSPRMTKLVVKF